MNTIVVSPTGECQNISTAIITAEAGDRILVKPGVYQEDLIIDKPLEIFGDGEVADIVVESQNSHCISMKTDNALVRGLSLRNRAENCCAVDIPQGKLRVENCDITSDFFNCIEIHGSEAEGIVSSCKIHDGKEAGVFVVVDGTGTIKDCDIFGNALAGIVIGIGGNSLVQNCKIHDGKEAGVVVFENGTGTIKDCDIFGNALAGIEIREGGNLLVQNCKIHSGKSSGIFATNGKGTIKNCEIFGNALDGIEISGGGCNPVVQNCKIYNSKGSGVYVVVDGTGRIENCEIFGNAKAGIETKDRGNPVVQNCTIKENAYEAVRVHYLGAGTIENCDLRDNAKGAWYIGWFCKVRRSGNKE